MSQKKKQHHQKNFSTGDLNMDIQHIINDDKIPNKNAKEKNRKKISQRTDEAFKTLKRTYSLQINIQKKKETNKNIIKEEESPLRKVHTEIYSNSNSNEKCMKSGFSWQEIDSVDGNDIHNEARIDFGEGIKADLFQAKLRRKNGKREKKNEKSCLGDFCSERGICKCTVF